MTTKNLYHIQDSDRPMYVLAPDWSAALDAWRAVIKKESDSNPPGPEPQPDGIALVCDGSDVVEHFETIDVPLIGGPADGEFRTLPRDYVGKPIQVMGMGKDAAAGITDYELAYVPVPVKEVDSDDA